MQTREMKDTPCVVRLHELGENKACGTLLSKPPEIKTDLDVDLDNAFSFVEIETPTELKFARQPRAILEFEKGVVQDLPFYKSAKYGFDTMGILAAIMAVVKPIASTHTLCDKDTEAYNYTMLICAAITLLTATGVGSHIGLWTWKTRVSRNL